MWLLLRLFVLSLSLRRVYAGLLEDHGYTVTLTEQGLYNVTSPHYMGGRTLDLVDVEVEIKAVTVYVAMNGNETDHENHLYLSQVLAALCEKKGLDLADLKWVRFHNVLNPPTEQAIRRIWARHHFTIFEGIRLHRHDNPKDWELFSSTPFYKAVAKMIDEDRIYFIGSLKQGQHRLLIFQLQKPNLFAGCISAIRHMFGCLEADARPGPAPSTLSAAEISGYSGFVV